MGTIIAWVLVRDRFPGKGVVNSLIDLPFALPTIVAGLTLLALYGPSSPVGLNLAFTRAGIVLALLLVTLPFVVRSVQPVLLELDREMEQAAASLGAGRWTIFRRIIFPNLVPAILGGTGLAFARALGEFGSLVLIAGNVPFDTQVSSLYIVGQIESDRHASRRRGLGEPARDLAGRAAAPVGPRALELAPCPLRPSAGPVGARARRPLEPARRRAGLPRRDPRWRRWSSSSTGRSSTASTPSGRRSPATHALHALLADGRSSRRSPCR